eukprot:CAMPEP_0113298476 /NCGR_PEP_ID=MMETSP0010_2-20120614/905_1 /TAXON_ID=216773 ORGANISM="Corethron hystrix, Strain 308" /NCGR_SAMPLE_ID=MMETSP0010_2 /ASSEMBLY_ACC=CAM_ASM_000155 /LENGTH=324 /DNA_ID=CAMNT_0000151537 /DNA_START=251 /DNA_END=1225 /DNA_ORIENTATION=- /assembly_acc=CAM_ASM_000155
MEAPFPGNGNDFDQDAPYRMYHGEKIPGFPQHPHRGFETITATIEGIIDHADSMGNAGRYGQGDLQWMTAGKGIVHGEMFPLVNVDKPNHAKFFQIWLNLPRAKKMVDPSFAMFWAHEIPKFSSKDGKASVTSWFGDYFVRDEFGKSGADANACDAAFDQYGASTKKNLPPLDSWAADPENDVAVLHISLKPGGKLVLPKSKKEGVNRSLYLVEGYDNGVLIGKEKITQKVVLDMDSSQDVKLYLPESSNGSCEFLLLQGKPIDEPVAQHGPFVMNTYEEISQAFKDYRRTQFGGWPWPKEEMVFPQDKGRFALLSGKETTPNI